MNSEFSKDYQPIWCEDCNIQGFIFIDDPEGAYFVICKSCGWETSEVWCSKCGMGGDFVKNISRHPPSWICPNCKTKYQLPDDFYEKPTALFTEKELPPLVQDRIKRELEANQPSLMETLWLTIKWSAVAFVLIAIGLLPMALVYTPLPWTIPGFIATLVVFAVWWWLMGKGIKIIRERSAKR